MNHDDAVTTVGRAVLALDDLLTDPDPVMRAAVARLRAATVPPWLDDQIAAATDETARALGVMGATSAAGPVSKVAPADVPGWARLGLLDALTRWVSDEGATCLHGPHPMRPEPIAAAAWKPGLVVCAQCAHLLRLPRHSDADRRCDGCGRVTAGLDVGDGVWPVTIQAGPLSFMFGCCRDCRYWVDADEAR